jgi:hypothetical protein
VSQLTISAASKQYVRVVVAAKVAGQSIDPTGDAVAMAFLSNSAAPASGDWKTASWDAADTTSAVPVYRARCLVGPGGDTTLTPGIWTVWVKVTDNPEVPVLSCGPLKVV